MIANDGVVDDFLNPNLDPNLTQMLFDDNNDDDNSSDIQRNSDGAIAFSPSAPILNSDDGFLSSPSISFDGTGSSLTDPVFNIDNVNKYDTKNNGNDNIFLDNNKVLLDDDKQSNSNLLALDIADDHLSALPSSSECSSSSSFSSPSRLRLRARENNGGFCIRADGTGIDFLNPDEVSKYWCSKTMFPDFLNIPVCRSRKLDLFDHQDEIPDFVVPGEVRLQLTGYINLDNIYHSERISQFLAPLGRRFLFCFLLFHVHSSLRLLRISKSYAPTVS